MSHAAAEPSLLQLSAPVLPMATRRTGHPNRPQGRWWRAHQVKNVAVPAGGKEGYMSEEGFDSDATVRPGGGPAAPFAAPSSSGLARTERVMSVSIGQLEREGRKEGRAISKGSMSQPDLTALRGREREGRERMGRKEVEGWVGEVGRGQRQQPLQDQPKQDVDQGKRRPSLGRTKSVPDAPKPIIVSSSQIVEPWLPAAPSRSPHSRSHASLTSMRKSPSPRPTPLAIPTMSPITSKKNLVEPSLSPRSLKLEALPVVASADRDISSEEGDGDSESDGSLSFVSKRRALPGGELRQRLGQDGGVRFLRRSSSTGSDVLGLSFDSPSSAPTTTSTESISLPSSRSFSPLNSALGSSGAHDAPDATPKSQSTPMPPSFDQFLQRSSLFYLRLLAVFPAAWSIGVLLQAFVTGGLYVDVWPYGIDLSKEALERLVNGGDLMIGKWIDVNRGDILLCIAWAYCTGYFCFCLTTGLTHRWLSYYSLPSTITRLTSLQCLCWPMTYLTLWVLGARNSRPLLAWVVIGVTTGWSRTVQMWVTSNVVPSDLSPLASTTALGLGIHPNDSPSSYIHPSSRRGSKQHHRAPSVTMPMGPPPAHLSWWEQFLWGRRWDWDSVAREVGWRVGGLLLVTVAWLFWGIECGRIVRG
ncbi:hypothetical protein L198_04355 [Cryptococcus wingfieldii CBS 7118]|uniref:Uncharacterized protein n=1 Tax=Cryptococcus wingfieldii CBS 7118 TaxID=1295528 RepID=A0A1E3J4G8_9TREE|nr:hypothetical protein L198_04355 [Cryptococcus wingfieldii CBS 7118]ODN95737.1 hypothetical protein L198_04355 [Cryptococcus wingfieldii CBS 7118]